MFLVGQYRDQAAGDARAWEYQGIFSTHELAVAACKGPGFFIFPVTLDEEVPVERMDIDPEYPLLHCAAS